MGLKGLKYIKLRLKSKFFSSTFLETSEARSENRCEVRVGCCSRVKIVFFFTGKTNKSEQFKTSKNTPSLKGVFAKNERGYRLNAIKKRF